MYCMCYGPQRWKSGILGELVSIALTEHYLTPSQADMVEFAFLRGATEIWFSDLVFLFEEEIDSFYLEEEEE